MAQDVICWGFNNPNKWLTPRLANLCAKALSRSQRYQIIKWAYMVYPEFDVETGNMLCYSGTTKFWVHVCDPEMITSTETFYPYEGVEPFYGYEGDMIRAEVFDLKS